MALLSPGIEVTIIDESNYLPAATNSVPYILIATSENKPSGTGGVAVGTLAENAGKVYLVTSQRDLATAFGNPFFYQTSNGTPINGFELNEYGLLAAHSVLGVTNRAYVQRADINLSDLAASLTRPTGEPDNGTYWLDTSITQWGVFQWNQETGSFQVRNPIVISNPDLVEGGVPIDSLGTIGSYAVITTNASNPVYYKNTQGEWVLVGSEEWKKSWPTIQGTNTVVGQALTQGQSIVINGVSVAVPAAETLQSLVDAINTIGIPGIDAAIDSNNRFVIYADSNSTPDSSSVGGIVSIDSSSDIDLLLALGVSAKAYYAPLLQQSPNYTIPRWRKTDTEPRPTGSVWNKITAPNQGAVLVLKKYDSVIGGFISQTSAIYENDQSANAILDPIGGGQNISGGTLYVQYNVAPESTASGSNSTLTLRIFERLTSGITVISGNTSDPVFTVGNSFTISASRPNSTELTSPITVTIGGTGTAADFVNAINSSSVPGVGASLAPTGEIVLSHFNGGVIALKNIIGTPVSDAGFVNTVRGIRSLYDGSVLLSNWVQLDYIASPTAPGQAPNDGRYWYYAASDQVDIMVHDGVSWVGYRNLVNDVRGFNLTQTNPTGPIVAALTPTTQTDGSPLVYGDLWIDTRNVEQYPIVKRWENINGVDQWVTIDNADQTTENGILFADARWAPDGTTDPIADNIPSISSLLVSNYTDLDAPSPALYPAGTLLWNTRRSGLNVKTYRKNYFNAFNFSVDAYNAVINYSVGSKVLYNGSIYVAVQSGAGNLPTNDNFWAKLNQDAWVTSSGNRNDGSPYMGRLAVRSIIVAAMKKAIDTQEALREEQNVFNLIAVPGYPELIPNMVALNNDRSNTAFVVGDTPLRLSPENNDIASWSNDANGLGVFAGDGLTTSDSYTGVFYPACQTNDLSGNLVVQPASHMMLRTIIRSDNIAYPWLAPAGTRRGLIDNAARIGYINDKTGEFISFANGQGVRDTLYQNRVNPITFIPGSGLVNYGNKTLAAGFSSLDRINVARLVAFIRGRLNEISKSFLFEPNDPQTRNELSNAISGLLVDLVAKRGIYDFLVVCDESNNTPARVDRNELYVDIAIEPTKATEFIFIPIRLKNTGELSGSGA